MKSGSRITYIDNTQAIGIIVSVPPPKGDSSFIYTKNHEI